MAAPASHRGFLSGLASLPLIGGSVALIGSPKAVAAPVTEVLLREYHDWLMYERSCLVREMCGPKAGAESVNNFYGEALRWHRARGELRLCAEGRPMGDGVSFPSTRAALVLSTVGCGWGATL